MQRTGAARMFPLVRKPPGRGSLIGPTLSRLCSLAHVEELRSRTAGRTCLMRLPLVITTMTLLLVAAARGDNQSEAARYLVKAYPPAEQGVTRFAIILPKLENEGNYKVELIVGKKVMVDAVNRHWFEGEIQTVNIEGWGFSRYVVKDFGPMAGTLIGGPTELKEKFVTLESILIRYNSRLPIAVYVPEGAEVRYRIWSTTPESKEMPEG